MGTCLSKEVYEIVRYENEPESIIIACFFNPTRSIARLKAFRIWYDTVKHLNIDIIECVLGDQKPQLSKFPKVRLIKTKVNLWHKEAILNKIIQEIDSKKYKYVY